MGYNTEMEASVLICHQFDIENPNPKFVNIPSIMKSESTSKR